MKKSFFDNQLHILDVERVFQNLLMLNLDLFEVKAPLFLEKGCGLNDDLNGVERKVTFDVPAVKKTFEIVNSLAKWKRHVLNEYQNDIEFGSGIVCRMNAIRQDEEKIDATHSFFVDQFDWEMKITPECRNVDFLKNIVQKIYEVLRDTDLKINGNNTLTPNEKIFFITSYDLIDMYPHLQTSKEREKAVCQEHKAVFVMNIGGNIGHPIFGIPHDLRAPDYDDWNLNGDILVWNPVLNDALELSSMGIRVDCESLEKQLKITNTYESRKELPYHKAILENRMVFSIGGGIGRSRVVMFILQKENINSL